MPLTVGKQGGAGGKHRRFQPQSSQNILHRAPRLAVHMHIASRHQGQATGGTQRLQFSQAAGVIRARMQFRRQPEPPGKTLGQPAAILGGCPCPGHPQHQAIGQGTLR